MGTFEPFDISVLGATKRYVWVSAQSRQGSVFGVCRSRPRWKLSAGTATEWMTTAVRRAYRVDDEALRVGQVLRDLVFGDPAIANLFAQTRGVAADDGSQLLVRVLAAPQDVSAWPWELMVDPREPSRYLTKARDVHLVRAGRSRTYPVRDTVIEPPLNVLLVMSSPLITDPNDSETPFDLWAEKRSLLTTLRPLVDRGLLNVVVEDRPTTERLRERMCAQRRGFHIVHYLGHANPNGLRLQQRGGVGRLVRSHEFAMLLQQMPDLRLAVFAGCETARAPDGPDMYSTADVCVRDACPMVVGMQAVLPFGTERIFTKFFYEALTGGQTVAQALRLARLAIADDDDRVLNWAVPSLFVGGSEPGPMMDPAAEAAPPPPRRHLTLKLGIRQRELRFIARLSEIRKAVDMLSGHTSLRLLVVIGPPQTGKTSLLDRALEELDDGVVSLFISAKRLLEAKDPVLELATVVAERIDASEYVTATKQARFDSDAWWERLLEDLARVPFALVIDDGDLLRLPAGARLAQALSMITMRRGCARLAVIGTDDLSVLTAPLGPGEARTIRLQALRWNEVWQWIRRNLPVLNRIDPEDLCGYYAKLPHLEQWERLAELISGQERGATDNVAQLVDQIAGKLDAGEPAPPPVFGALESPVSPQVVRVAVQGVDPDEFTARMTQAAAAHHVAGRMAGVSGSDRSSLLAELLTIPASDDAADWVAQALVAGANLIVVDSVPPDAVLEQALRENRLIITVDPAEKAFALVRTAILVWATDRYLKAQDVRDVVHRHRFDLAGALRYVRTQLLVDALEWGPLELDALLAETGMKAEVAMPLLDELCERGAVEKVGVERYEKPDSLYSTYNRLCGRHHGRVNEHEFTRLGERVSELAMHRRFTSDEPRALWNTGDEGRRLIALVIIKTRPDLGDIGIVIEGIRKTRSPLEHLQAFHAAHAMLPRLSTQDCVELRAAAQEARFHGRAAELNQIRSDLLVRLADRLPEVA